MTYCVAMCLEAGLVFLSDSRTNAGVDHISTFRKMSVFEQPGERLIVLLSAGNLATTQSVVTLLRQRLKVPAEQLGRLQFQWQIEQLITGADMAERDAGDGRVWLKSATGKRLVAQVDEQGRVLLPKAAW